MTTRFTGGCICGAVRYECGADPIAMGNCHCRDCQRATGSAFAAAVLVPTSAVKITGKPAASPDIMSIMAGSLDESSWFRLQADIYTASAQPWDYMNPDLPKFPGLPQN
jgi:hypothetical protein